MEKGERLAIFYERLREHPPVADEVEAREILAKLLEQVEDEFSGVLREPESDARMYPPWDDNRTVISKSPRIVHFRSRGHRTYFRGDGAILIIDMKTKVEVFQKLGKDGVPFAQSDLPST